MKRGVPILLAALLLPGCSTVGNVVKKTGQVLMDPSIPVGAPDDQPTQIALSLYASSDVNPNPESAPPGSMAGAPRDTGIDATQPDGPYAVNFNSQTKADLITSLRGLLDYLQKDDLSIPPLPPLGDSRSPFSLDDSIRVERSPMANARIARPPLPYVLAPWQSSLGGPNYDARAADVPLPLLTAGDKRTSSNVEPPATGLALGQYATGPALPASESPRAPIDVATPVAFKILQLKDDSLLLNADPQQLAKDLKKALGSTYVEADDYVLQPGQFKFVNFTAIQKDTRYVAIVADFHNPNGAVWKQAFQLDPKGRKYALLVTLQNTQVAIRDESYRPPQPRTKP